MHFATKGRGEATLKKVGSVETWFRGERDCQCCGGEEEVVTEKGTRERGTHRGMYKKNVSPRSLAYKMSGAELCELLPPAGIKPWRFRGQQAWLGSSQNGTVLLPEKRQTNNLGADSMEKVI